MESGDAPNGVKFLPKGSKCEVRNLYEGEPDRRGRTTWTNTYPTDLDEPVETSESAQYALLVRNKKSYDGRKKLEIHSIVIQSKKLKKVLGTVLRNYPGVTTSLDRLEFSPPFQPFVHRWEAFVKARDTEKNAETKAHIDLLYSILEPELRDAIRTKEDHVTHGVITFDNIWTIFEPGCIVYSKDEGHIRGYRLQTGNFQTTASGTRYYSLSCNYIDYDGEKFGYASERLTVPSFNGTARITALPVYPFDFHHIAEALKGDLIKRGKLFESYQGFHFKSYEGIALGQGCWGAVRFSVNSRIIIDTYVWNRFNPNRKVSLSGLTANDDDDDDEYLDEDEPMKSKVLNGTLPKLLDEELLICAPTLRGYSLRDKKWLEFYIESIKPIAWNEDAFESLVAPPGQKDLLLAFAQSQARNKEMFDDVIQGKGRGIIMLLSGPPGVGKTLTAESVAEEMRVPLYTMSAGDLGTEPSQVESALSNILEMATKWNAVLLLDEADVFLEARSNNDLERNKLVSIFLRLLEYYEGILFLTTNRVDNIDAAFESRIHLSLQYSELDRDARHSVWAAFLKRSTNLSRFRPEELDKLSEVKLNGRQIKNVLKTAQLLAARAGTGLAYTHIETVLALRAMHKRE